MHEIARKTIIALPVICGVDLSITNEVVLLWVAAAITFLLLFMACRRKELVAHGWYENLFEGIIEYIEKEVVHANIGQQGYAWSPFLLTLFFFILFCNLLGMVPFPNHFKAITSNISVTAGLALVVFATTFVLNLKQHGLFGFLKKFAPAGVPRWILILLIPIEIISWLARPASLAIRLFANMMAGHALLFVFIGLIGSVAWFLKPFPFVGALAMDCFELFVMFVQAFVFTMLAGIYIREAVEAH